ncbi:MAG: glycosyltransferase family A protein [Reyranellaceae bacterium]
MAMVTIGMPVFNGANYVTEAVQSILDQTYGDFELVISDNASTDATEEICRGLAARDRRLRYIRQPRNVGAAVNHNLVFAACDGRYFKWASHDDLLHPRFLATTVAVLEARPEVSIASPASALIDAHGQALRYAPERGGMVDLEGTCWPRLPEDNPGLASADPVTRFTSVMLNTVMCVEIYGLMRREAASRTSLIGPFSGSDKVMLAEMALRGPFWLGPEVLFYRRCHAKQFSASKSGAYRALWYSGRRDSLLTQQLKLLGAYCRSAATGPLRPSERGRCVLAVARRAVGRGQQLRRLTNGLVGNA